MKSSAARTPSGTRALAARLAFISLFVFAGALLADLGVLYSRRYMLPTQPPPARPKTANLGNPFANYQNVVSRNIFNADGTIPDPLIVKERGKGAPELPPIPSQLPITLTGTLVHSNPDKSLAALELKGKNQILSFRPKQQIENLATLERVERMKIFIRNLNTGRLEYIEMKNAPKVSLKTASTNQGGDVKKTGDNEFEIKKSDLLKYTGDLSSILMQARVVPAKRGGNGEIYGYRVVEMQPGSIYTQLGLQTMDVITGVNGTPVTSPQQAMEMYTTLRNSNHIELNVERGGRNQTLKFNVN